jgi:hypothetical protein
MLEVTTVSQELVLGVDFSDIYKNSELYQSVTYFQPLLLPAYKNCKCDF